MREIVLEAEARTSRGKGAAREVRRQGKIPGVVYGPETDPVTIAIDERVFRATLKSAGRSSVVNLKVNGTECKVLIRELQRDPVTSDVLHVDFHAISMDKPITVKIPVRMVGEAPGVKAGGIMQTTLRELEIACLPVNIPDYVEVSIEGMQIGESVHVSDIDLPDVEILSELRRTVVVIAAPTIIKAVAAEEEAEGEEGEEGEAAEGEGEGEGAEKGEKTEEDKKEQKSE